MNFKLIAAVGNYWKWPEEYYIFYKKENMINEVETPVLVNSRGHNKFTKNNLISSDLN